MPDAAPELACPAPFAAYDRVVLAHGGGGRAMRSLIERVFVAAFENPWLRDLHDGALLHPPPGPLAFTTDTFTVQPLFFPGGDIGSLAVHGTVNDLAMCGARPLYLSAGFVLEEGLPLADLSRVAASMARAAREAGVNIVTGDTTVVERGHGDGVFINTAGVGAVVARQPITARRVLPGDAVLLSGPVGDHAMAVLALREGLAIQTDLASDSACVAAPVLALLGAGLDLHCLRDPTRGGLAAALNEIAAAAGVAVAIDEPRVPVRPAVADASELLGLDPLHLACEGRFVAFLPASEAPAALDALAPFPVCAGATVIGRVTGPAPRGLVVARGALGGERVLDMLSGEQFPRIC
ncbi:MAG: hydrogenase expression/formation protein HypE [Planctomycetes bacterium]|nr:hydrogenase expression/formation protein HypE [Planctomycetota bacterium]